MAKSKSGGTRSYIRGKIGADVYSIGKDGKGAKQQVVRSLAEVVSNPQTQLQMKGRMIMSTVMQAVSALAAIIDHSFDGLPTGQPSISEFISRNYALVKADVASHPSASNTFGLVKYQEKGARAGLYVISNGKAANVPFTRNQGQWDLAIVTSAQSANATVQDLLSALGITVNDFFTLVEIGSNSQDERVGAYLRLKVKPSVALDAKIATLGITNIFDCESNMEFSAENNLSYSNGTFSIAPQTVPLSSAFITSIKTANGWEHSKSTMVNMGTVNYPADVALPTYPVGTQRFLNGGDL